MNWQSDVINEALVCDGYEFIDHNARARYIREDRAKRPQWLNDNHCKWRRLSDVLGRAAQRASSDDAFVKVDPNSSSSGLKPTAENVVTAAAIRWSVETASPPNATIAATLLQTIVESAVVIDGRTCITTEQFASMLEVSERTLYRMFAYGKGPRKIKLPSVFYELDDALKWTDERKRGIKPI
jgi:predicted DNA-binding transcriptional regulator AlpA